MIDASTEEGIAEEKGNNSEMDFFIQVRILS